MRCTACKWRRCWGRKGLRACWQRSSPLTNLPQLPWGKLMAASVLTAVPVTILYMYAQRFLAEGLTVGAVKG